MMMVRLAMLVIFISGCTSLGSATEAASNPEESCGASGWHIPDDEELVCNVGSACRDEYRQANGSDMNIWPDEETRVQFTRLQTEKNRLMLNKYQPSLVPKFTEIGYEKEKLDPETYKYLLGWFRSVKNHKRMREQWPPENTYVNHWKHETQMVPSPKRVHDRLFEALQSRMEEWVGGRRLKPTACYGVRIYPRGSILANHVDRVDTHVVSAIINVEQTNLDADWPLFVRGHDGIDHNVFLEPGEVVFYESASVLHGRPTPFEGEGFANIFVHFAPMDDWSLTAIDVSAAATNDRRKAREKLGAAVRAKAKAKAKA